MAKALLLNEKVAAGEGQLVALPVARKVLWTRQWRGTAADGTVVAVELAQAACHGDIVRGEGRCFRIAQLEEPVLCLPLGDDPDLAAKLGWYLGNRHLSIEVRAGQILLEAIPGLTDTFDRIGICYSHQQAVLQARPHGEHTH